MRYWAGGEGSSVSEAVTRRIYTECFQNEARYALLYEVALVCCNCSLI